MDRVREGKWEESGGRCELGKGSEGRVVEAGGSIAWRSFDLGVLLRLDYNTWLLYSALYVWVSTLSASLDGWTGGWTDVTG